MSLAEDGLLIVAIDGPSGTGKSSVSKAVATALGIGYLDTGAMYRALTWWCVDRGIDLHDRSAVAREAQTFPLAMGTDPAAPTVQVGDLDIAAAIRTPSVSSAVSDVATNLGVREQLIRRQRELMARVAAETGGVVAEGRDITTVVAPDATVRILMTASEEARIARRAGELASTAAATRAQVVDRDQRDSAVASFMTAADGVVTVDTSHLDFDGSVKAVLAVVDEGRGRD
ncbi:MULTISPECIES: (d)CMP kinase [unclassified Allobranchiibius]|uniref:(d)CMP kinase n=1 Tax=unclassified Allobranchiibius TaxID=2649857 RepID=UPI001AA0C0E8|nr:MULTISPECIES: (d)CMP kinase [unclassified Allobranchiibius]MBO1766341.1 (d)CMP kinase [Allobranchiibius sp. GilTou38]UIJ34060.1 (d)CMP kinase [Allobranchiibius sp. GilTou73]